MRQLVVRRRGAALDVAFELARLGGVIVDPEQVGGQAERGIATSAEAGGGQEPVFQGEVRQTAALRLAARRPFQAPARQPVQAPVRGGAGRQELEPISPAQKGLQPPRLQRHADGSQAESERPVAGGGHTGVLGGAGSAKHVCYPDRRPLGTSPEQR